MVSVTQRNVYRRHYVYTPGGTDGNNRSPLSRRAVYDRDSNQENSEYKSEPTPLQLTHSVKLSCFSIYILKEANFRHHLFLNPFPFLTFVAGDICFCWRFVI